ncbi:MAG: hypothetical protein K2W82_17005 [Candidatus Obscuribacterales bacterium]|nr:hypothetical protein [Candidatus Obscuribacterales bacterium]
MPFAFRCACLLSLFAFFLPSLNASAAEENAAEISAVSPTKTIGERFLDAVPDGGSISFEDFSKKAGDDVAGLLRLMKPTKISRKGGHVVLECQPGPSVTDGGITVNLGKTVECDLTAGPDSIKMESITGVTVQMPAGLGTPTLESATMTRNADQSVKISGVLRKLRFIPRLPFNITLPAPTKTP